MLHNYYHINSNALENSALSEGLDFPASKKLKPIEEKPIVSAALQAILVIDLDDTILALAASKKKGALCLINPTALYSFMENRLPTVKLLILTSRRYVEEEQVGVHYLTAGNVLRTINATHALGFERIIYTGGKEKSTVLENLAITYGLDKQKVVLIDNDVNYIKECMDKGFRAVIADDQGSHWNWLNNPEFVNKTYPQQSVYPHAQLSPQPMSHPSQLPPQPMSHPSQLSPQPMYHHVQLPPQWVPYQPQVLSQPVYHPAPLLPQVMYHPALSAPQSMHYPVQLPPQPTYYAQDASVPQPPVLPYPMHHPVSSQQICPQSSADVPIAQPVAQKPIRNNPEANIDFSRAEFDEIVDSKIRKLQRIIKENELIMPESISSLSESFKHYYRLSDKLSYSDAAEKRDRLFSQFIQYMVVEICQTKSFPPSDMALRNASTLLEHCLDISSSQSMSIMPNKDEIIVWRTPRTQSTLLIEAARSGYFSVIRKLINTFSYGVGRGLQPERLKEWLAATDVNGDTALSLAERFNRHQPIKLLTQAIRETFGSMREYDIFIRSRRQSSVASSSSSFSSSTLFNNRPNKRDREESDDRLSYSRR